MSRQRIDWGRARDFQRDRYPPGELERLDPTVLYRLQAGVRDPLGQPLHISPVPGAVARFTGSPGSRHYAVGKQSTAIDWFAPRAPLQAWRLAVREFGGVGIYYDTQYNGAPCIMLHTDLRGYQLWWCRENGVYTYPHKSDAQQARFFDLLAGLAEAEEPAAV